MRQYSVFHPLYLSYYSKKFYADVIKNWKGISFLYLLILSIILTIPITVQVKMGVSSMANEMPAIVKQVPEIRIVGGIASTPQTRPYLIKESATGKVIAIVDTSGQYTSLDKSEAKVLLTRTKIQYRQSDYEIREYTMANVNDVTITQEVINEWVRMIDTWLPAVLAPFIMIGVYVFKLLAALLYSLIVLIVSRASRINIPYSSKLSLCIIAMTPASLLLSIFDLLSIPVPEETLFSILVTCGYAIFGMLVNKTELT